MDIQKIIDNAIAHRAGFAHRPADNGGPINMGITQKLLTTYLARNVSAAEVENLSKQTARDIYYAYYYIKAGIKDLPELIRPIMLDLAVDTGKRGIKILQDALLCAGYDCGRVDGYIGGKTIAAAHSAEADLGNELIAKLVRRWVIYLEGIVKADDSQREQLPRWIARAESFLPKPAILIGAGIRIRQVDAGLRARNVQRQFSNGN